MTRLFFAGAMALALTGCAKSPPNPWHLVDPQPVREWCAALEMPEPTPNGWASCSMVTRGDAERLAAHRTLVLEQRRKQ